MKTQTDDTIDVLNDLIETCRDGAHGFRTAAEDAKDGQLRAVFQGYAVERESFARELRALVASLGGDAEESGSVAGAMHRGWIDLKAAIASNEPKAVLNEAERGEDAAVDHYRKALERVQDPVARDLIGRQFVSVKAAHDRVRDLRDSYRAAAR